MVWDFLAQIFAVPDMDEFKEGVLIVLLGLGIWKLNHSKLFFADEIGVYLRNLSIAYAATLFLTNHIQAEGLMLYILWTVSYASFKQRRFGWVLLFWVLKLSIVWFFMLP